MTDELDDAAEGAAFKIFGDILRKQRQKSQWTFRQLAEKSGVSEDVISQLEVGENIGTETDREKLCEFLGVKVDTFAKLLRTQKTEMAIQTPPPRGSAPSNVVNIEGYRGKWAKTTTHPEA